MRSHILTKLDIDPTRAAADLDYLAKVPRIEEQYDEFSSGYWKNASLANASGDADDSTYRDIEGPAAITAHGQKTPYLIGTRKMDERFTITEWAGV